MSSIGFSVHIFSHPSWCHRLDDPLQPVNTEIPAGIHTEGINYTTNVVAYLYLIGLCIFRAKFWREMKWPFRDRSRIVSSLVGTVRNTYLYS